jgi:hypothetical protein
VGPIAPTPLAPLPAYEPQGLTTGYAGLDPGGTSTSYVPRKFNANGSIIIKIVGPTVPDYSAFSGVQLLSGVGGATDPANVPASATGEYVYTFASALPPGTTGTFVVGMEVRRNLVPSGYSPPQWYDKVNDVFFWPYTGETVNESAENAYVFVNTQSGIWPPPAGSPPPVPRRTIVDMNKCLRCHDRIEFHSGQKHDPNWCVTCHTHDASDIAKRLTPANAGRQWLPDGPVNLRATYDGVEERSAHFKTMIHRMHTGARKGVATLEGIAPYALYYGRAYFFDRGGFPNDLANCTLCHLGKTYLPEKMPGSAPPTIANEHATIWHAAGQLEHPEDEPSTPPVQAACTGCHASGATLAHVAAKTAGGVETCGQCHEKGPLSVEVAHGLAPPSGAVAATFSALMAEILAPRCGSCHSASGTPPPLDSAAAYDTLVTGSGPTGVRFVVPGRPEESGLSLRLRDMPPAPDSLLDPADVAAIEAWILNGAPND